MKNIVTTGNNILWAAKPERRSVARAIALMCLLIILGAAAMTPLSSCSRPPAANNASLGQEFILAPGQDASIEGEQLQIRFKEVINDSRCLKGVVCIWAGEVSCLVDITYQGSTGGMVLTLPGSGQAKTDFKDYTITFVVQPYPEAGKPIDKKDYRLQLKVDKKAALTGGILATFQVIDEQ